MSDYEIGKHPLTRVVEGWKNLRDYWVKIFQKFTPDIFSTLTYDGSPPHSDAALGDANKHGCHVSGALHEPVLHFTVIERGRVGGRWHMHQLIWVPSPPTKRDLQLFRRKWRHGISDFAEFDPKRGGIDYVGDKLAEGEDFRPSRKLVQRLRKRPTLDQ